VKVTTYPQTTQANGYSQDSVSGIWLPNLSHHGLPMLINYRDAIGIGVISGHDRFRGFGRRGVLATTVTGDDLWEGTATTIPIPDQTTGEQCTIVSTSANDTAAGSNVRTVDVHYLDAAGNEQVENVTLNGTTPVNTVATNIRFIQYIHSKTTAGHGIAAAGTISIYRTGDAARVYSTISVGANVSLNSQRMVPAGKTFYLCGVKCSSTSSKPVSVRFRATCEQDGTLTPGIFIFNEISELQDSTASLETFVPRKIPALAIMKATAYSAQAGGAAELSYEGFIE
jgi:hypothetical protein